MGYKFKTGPDFGNILLITILSIFIYNGCATGRLHFKKAEVLVKEKKYIEAIEYYMKAVRKKPEEARYRLRLMESMTEASNYFYREALIHRKEKDIQLALVELNKSLEYNPSNNLAKLEKRKLLKVISGESANSEKTWLEKLKSRSNISNRIPKLSNKEIIQLDFSKNVKLNKIFEVIAKIAKINIIFDSSFKNSKMGIKLKDVTLAQAISRICLMKNLFYKILDKNTIIIIPDTNAKRKIYNKQIIKVFYLSNIKAPDCLKIINRVTKIKNVTADLYLNTITVREIPEKVALVEKLIDFFDKRKAEVLVKIDIMEVNRDRLREYGVEFSQYQISQSFKTKAESTGISGNRFHYLNSSDFLFTIPTVIYKLLENDTDSKVIARPQVRGEDGEKIEIKLGDKVPVPRTTFVPFATGGVDQQPITSYDLLDVGIEITLLPKIHHNGEISMDLNFKLTFITSPGTTTLPPTIGNRSVKTKIRLKDGETGIMAGLLRDTERRSRKGIPGLSKIPLIGELFSSNRKQATQTDIILRVTPYIIRMPDIREKDLAPINSGTEKNIYLENIDERK